MASSVVIGRPGERSALAGAVARAGAGAAAAAVIEGEPGAGKTTLWREAVALAHERGLRVLEARPAQTEIALPFAGLGDLLDPHLDAALAGLPEPQRRALEVALLVGGRPGAAPDPRAIGVAVRGALRSMATHGPVAVAVDDIQWLDADSARVLDFALRRLDVEPVLVLVARRLEPGAVAPLDLDAVLARPDAVRVCVGPLAPAELWALLRERLGLALARPALGRLHEATRGNPLYALEIGRMLVGQDAADDPLASMPLPPSLRAALAARLAELSPAARQVLLAAAALARPTRERLCSVDPRARAGLGEAAAGGVVEFDGELVRFVHPLFASVIHAEADAAQRRATHRRLSRLGDDPEAQAAHLALAADGPDGVRSACRHDHRRVRLRVRGR